MQERGINGNYGLKPAFCKSCRKSNRMRFGYAYIKKPFGKFCRKLFEPCPIRHSCRYSRDSVIFAGKLSYLIRKMTGKSLFSIFIRVHRPFLDIKRGYSMKPFRIFLCELITFPFLGHYVDKYRLFKLKNIIKNCDQLFCIVSVYRTEVAKTQFLE